MFGPLFLMIRIRKIFLMKPLLLSLLLASSLCADPRVKAPSDQMALLYSQNGGYREQANHPEATLASTNLAMRTFRYLGIEKQDTSAQRAFLESCYDSEKTAFVEVGAEAPTIRTNAQALMLMGELRYPKNILAISARDYLTENAQTPDDIYIAMAGMVTMGLTHEIPASWLKTMMEVAVSEDPNTSGYQKARAIITCMRAGLNLPDYSLFLPIMEEGLKEVTSDPEFYHDPELLQHAYAFARATLMIDGRVELSLPDLDKLNSPTPNLSQLYRVTILQAWKSRLQGQLKVAISPGFAPISYRDEAGHMAGMDADLLRAFAEEEGYELLFVEQKHFNGIWELPARGHFDISVSGLTKRDDILSPGLRWSYPYFDVARSLSILKSNEDRFRNIADFDGMKIAVITGTTDDQDIFSRNLHAIRVPYDNEEAATKDLLAGKVHALSRSDLSNRHSARRHPELTVIDRHSSDPSEELVMAVASERVSLGQKLDRFLRNKRRSGELNKLFKNYLND